MTKVFCARLIITTYADHVRTTCISTKIQHRLTQIITDTFEAVIKAKTKLIEAWIHTLTTLPTSYNIIVIKGIPALK